MTPKISIIIPIYNVETYILSCLESVVSQTMTEGVECILVDDCGLDASMQIAKGFINSYSMDLNEQSISFKFCNHEYNKGLSAARNTGINVANGKYVYFLDSDDELVPDCIKNMYDLAEQNNADMVQGCYIADQSMLTNFCYNMPVFSNENGYIKRMMLDFDHFPVMAQNRLVRRDVIIGNNLYFKEGIIHEDNHWTFFLSKYINRLAISKTPTYKYRTTPGSIMSIRNVEREKNAFNTLITDFCNNIDSFEKGAQKTLILNTIILMLRGKYYESQEQQDALISLFAKNNNHFERLFLALYLKTNNTKMLHLLIRLYNL